MLKVMLIILATPFLLCLGVYGCAAVHVAAFDHAVRSGNAAGAMHSGNAAGAVHAQAGMR